MTENILHTAYLAAAFLALFASAEIMFHKFNVKAEVTRKYVHLCTGLLTMLFPPLLGNHWFVLLLCGSFLVILLVSLKFKLLPSINAVERQTRGSILFPVIVYGCFLIYTFYGQFTFYYIPILILAICDPVAALVGKRWPTGEYTTFGHKKTLSGSAGFFISAVLTCLFLIVLVDGVSWGNGLIVALIVSGGTVVAEALTHKGYDNLTIPASAVLTLMALSRINLLDVGI